MNSEQKQVLNKLAQIGNVVFVDEAGRRVKVNEQGKLVIENQADAVIFAIQSMDSNRLNLLLEEGATYLDTDKHQFIDNLAATFNVFLSDGDTFLKAYKGHCGSKTCSNTGCKGFSFVGNKTGQFLDLIIAINDGKVTNITECYGLINEDTGLSKDERIIISSDFPF